MILRRKTKIIVAIVVLIIVIAACWALLQVGQYPHKLWLHRCNSIEKWCEKEDIYDNIEVDVVWRDSVFDVTHDTDKSFNQRLEPFFAKLKEGGDGKIWLDMKNVTLSNVTRVVSRINYLLSCHALGKERLIIECKDVEALRHLDNQGFYTSYYIDFPKPSDIEDSQVEECLDSIEGVVAKNCCDAISFPSWWYNDIKREFSDSHIDLLTWCHRTTQFEFFLSPWCYEMLNDPQLKVILIKDKGSFHR